MLGRTGTYNQEVRRAPSGHTKQPAQRKSIKQSNKPLWKHQKQTLKLIAKQKRVFDTSDPGTGKTRVALEGWAKRKGGCALIIACRRLLQPAWGNDIKQYLPGYEYSIAYASNRKQAFDVDADIYITNTDAVKWLAQQPPRFFKKFDTLIIDESPAFKHRTSQRSKALDKIKHHFEYRHLLTGTPNSNTILDVWNQIRILDDGARLGTSFFAFRAAVCQPTQVGKQAHMVRWDDKPFAEQVVTDLIKDITIRHEFDKVMDVPENYTRFITYQLEPKQLIQYLKMEKDAILELENDAIVGVNAAVLRNKLLQIASGAVYSENGYALLDTGRYELIADLVEERKQSLVFYSWRHQRDELSKEMKRRKIPYIILDGDTSDKDTDRLVAEFQRGDYQTLMMHPKTGAHGLTLTKATAAIVASPIYEADFMKQIIHRIKRGGQTQKTETILVEAEGTVERKVFERRMLKTGRMENFLELLRC